MLFVRLIAFALLLCATPALAAEPTAAEIAVARRLYREAVSLEEAGKWAEAETKLREAIAIKETPGLRYHLAVSQEKQGKLVEALVDFDRADEMIQRGARAPDVEKLLGPARDGVRSRVPTVTVSAPPDADKSTLEIDGKAFRRSLFGQPIPLNPGQHRVRVTAEGFQPFEVEITLSEADKKSIDVTLKPAVASRALAPSGASEPGADVASDSAPGSSSSARTYVLIGGAAFTAVALATGIGFTLYGNDRDDQAQAADAYISAPTSEGGLGAGSSSSACQNPSSDAVRNTCRQLDELLDDRDQARTFALIGFIGAGVGAAATVATYFLWPEASERAAVGVTPVAGGALVGVGGRF